MSSTASSALTDEDVLYKQGLITVTPSWLTIRNTSYAIRYLQKLTYVKLAPPRIAAGIIFLLSIVLTVWQVLRMDQQSGSNAVGWILLALCIFLLLISSFVAFVMPTRYRIDIVLANEPLPLMIKRKTEADSKNLHGALADAMDWYRGNPEITPALQDEASEQAGLASSALFPLRK